MRFSSLLLALGVSPTVLSFPVAESPNDAAICWINGCSPEFCLEDDKFTVEKHWQEWSPWSFPKGIGFCTATPGIRSSFNC